MLTSNECPFDAHYPMDCVSSSDQLVCFWQIMNWSQNSGVSDVWHTTENI